MFDKSRTVKIGSLIKFALIGFILFIGATKVGFTQEEPKVSLLADAVFVEADGQLLAIGNVKISYDNLILHAEQVQFDNENYTIKGPLYISDQSGTQAVADFASLSEDYQRGIIERLRILYKNRLQITSGTVKRTNGSLIFFNNLITTCEVCTAGEKPVWYFQADSMALREEDGRIHLKNVTFKIWDVPLLYLPWFSIGSPASGRQSGFLVPEARYKSGRGLEAKIPYYLVLSDRSDLILSFGRTPAKKPGYNLEFRNNTNSGWIFFEAAYPFRKKENLGLFQTDLVLKGVQKPDETSQISFLITDTSPDNKSYPEGLFPVDNKLVFLEATKILPIGKLSFRSIDISSINFPEPPPEKDEEEEKEDEEEEKKNKFERLVSLGFKTNDLLPNSRAILTFDFKLNSTLQDQDLNNYKHGSVLARLSDTRILSSGFKTSTTLFLLGEMYNQDIPDTKKHENYGRAMIVNNLSFPLILSSGNNHQSLTPFIQTVYSRDNNIVLPTRPEPLQVIDRSKFLANHQDITESWVRDGQEISLGLKYFTTFNNNTLDLIFGKTFLDAEGDPEYVHYRSKESHYFAEGILELGDNIEIRSMTVGDNKFRAVSSFSQLSLLDNDYELGVSYGWIRGDDNKDKSEALSSYLKVPLSDQWSGFANVDHDILGHSKREIELGAVYHHQCLTVEISGKRTLKTDTVDKTNPDYTIGLNLIGITSASTLSTKKCN